MNAENLHPSERSLLSICGFLTIFTIIFVGGKNKLSWEKKSLTDYWFTGFFFSMFMLFFAVPCLVAIIAFSEIFKSNNPLLWILAIIGAIIVFPTLQGIWMDIFKQDYKNKGTIVDLRLPKYKKKEETNIKF